MTRGLAHRAKLDNNSSSPGLRRRWSRSASAPLRPVTLTKDLALLIGADQKCSTGAFLDKASR